MADQPDQRPPNPEHAAPSEDEQQRSQPPTDGGQTAPDSKPAGWHEPPVTSGGSRPVAAAGWYRPENGAPDAESAPGSAAPDPADGQSEGEVPPANPPGPVPTLDGAWYTPPDAELNRLLSGAADTIIETPPTQSPRQTPPTDETPAWLSHLQASSPGSPDTDAQSTTGTPDQAQADQPPAEGWSMPPTPYVVAPQPDEPQTAAAFQTPPDDLAPVENGEGTLMLSTSDVLAAAEPPIPLESTPPPDSTPSKPLELSPAEAAFLAEQRAAGLLPPADAAPVQPVQNPQDATAAEAPGATGPQTDGGTGTPPDQPVQPGQPAPTGAPAAQSPAMAQAARFEDVERKVNILRQRYNAGYLTREELQNELRNLMILDDEGHWWMLGLESNRWYYYDGRDWVAANPPGYDERRVRGSAVRTETDLQQVVDSGGTPGTAPGPVQFENDDLPLPARVSQEDVGATLVSPSAAFMEPLRRSDAPTVPKGLESEANTLQYSRPVRDQGQGLTQPTRPDAADAMQQTMPHAVGHARETQEAGRVDPVSDQTVTHGVPPVGAAIGTSVSAAPGAAVSRPRPKMGEFPQPDYSAALGMSRNRSTYTKWGIRFAVLSVVGGMALTLLVLVGMVGYYFYKVNQYQGAVNTLSERAANFETTEIYDASGTLLAEFSNLENADSGQRKSVPLDQISPWLLHATIATENETFYTDPGFSVFAIVRATVQNLQAGGTVSGASTITQQLARALVLDTEFASQRTTERKIVEVIVASEIKRKYSKNEILEIYLNEIFYGNLSYGIEAAAQTYFNKSASELNPAEAAFLAGLPQSPAAYDPVINREAAMARMDDVLRLMSEANGTGCITIEHEDHTRWAVPNGGTLCVTARMTGSGDPIYYYQTPDMAAPEELTLDIAYVKTQAYNPPQFRARHPHFVNYVWQQLEDTYGSQAIYSAGFRVYTTLDENIQNAAEESVTATLAEVNARGFDVDNASVVAMRPSDGAVVAMVGSADYSNEEIDGQVNVAFTAQQPGSSIKPFVYLAALERQGDEDYWTPATIIWDTPTNFNGYAPTNFDLMFRGPVNVRNALANSLNVPAVKTLQFVTLERFTELAKRIGLRFPLGDPVERGAGLPTALGAVEVRLFDMTSAYAMLANNGRRVDPYSIVYIQDHQGNEVYRADTSPAGMRVVEPQYAYLLTSILADNEARAAEFGRGFPLELTNGRIAAVKTGTTNDNRDTWTVGYTPQMVVGVWMGNTDNHPMGNITGWGSSAHIWNAVMEKAHEGQPVQDFNPPDGLIQAEVCRDSGALPSSGTCLGGTYWEIFASSAPPPQASESLFQELQVDGYTGRLVNDHCRDWLETRTYLVLDDPTAYDWVNNSAGGNQWATARGLVPPLSPPPTDYCDPNEARPILVLSSPGENQTVEGTITLRGAVSMPQFNRYEIRYGTGHNPEAFSQPVIVETGQRPEGESVLGEFDTRQLPADGPYTIRLIGIDNYGRSVHRDVHITVRLPLPTPTPTSLPTPTLAPTQPGFGSTPAPDGSISIQEQAEAPTLTPTWTLTPTPQ